MAERSTAEQARHDGYCPACGYRTLDEGSTGSFAICPICFWEDEPYPLDDPDRVTGGPNGKLSLGDARDHVEKYGDIYEGGNDKTRSPRSGETRHPEWPFRDDG